jgi:polyphosphate kinase 2 (PPK2 family)
MKAFTFTDKQHEQRKSYFRALFRLQGELVKLQDSVVHTGHRLVVIFGAATRQEKVAPSSASRND